MPLHRTSGPTNPCLFRHHKNFTTARARENTHTTHTRTFRNPLKAAACPPALPPLPAAATTEGREGGGGSVSTAGCTFLCAQAHTNTHAHAQAHALTNSHAREAAYLVVCPRVHGVEEHHG